MYKEALIKGLLGLVLCVMSINTQATDNILIKLSANGLCLTQEDSLYQDTQQYILLYSLDECLNKGGRLPMTQNFKKRIQQSAISSQSHSHILREFNPQEWPHFSKLQRSDLDVRNYFLKVTSEVDVTIDRFNQVVSGKWRCPFTGNTMFRPDELSVIHIVPLRYAHDNGGAKLSRAIKTQFANDVSNLIVVHNDVKNDRDERGLSWTPNINKCWYVHRFNKSIEKYKLAYSNGDQDLIEQLMQICQ